MQGIICYMANRENPSLDIREVVLHKVARAYAFMNMHTHKDIHSYNERVPPKIVLCLKLFHITEIECRCSLDDHINSTASNH